MMRLHIADHRGMVGSAVVRQLEAQGGCEIVTRTLAELDSTEQGAVRRFFEMERVDQVYLAPAKVGAFMPTTPIRLSSFTTTC